MAAITKIEAYVYTGDAGGVGTGGYVYLGVGGRVFNLLVPRTVRRFSRLAAGTGDRRRQTPARTARPSAAWFGTKHGKVLYLKHV
ncbi:hypothetical protein [Streptomyces sp. TRM68367]|uniref:hypothetical protein n=1 Tax=Streptomyces sp. TRM68367 TaxID=2758415 RepID=UPI00165B5A11|nr:hypothetical protein [Streptomyces sp. TRM68367]MBC9728137.1 hypothetical protein [Streptomyces sp. TRM68367]